MNKLILFAVFLYTATGMSAQQKFNPPKTQAIPVLETIHNVTFTDNYRWLEDKKDAKVIEWTKSNTIMV